MAALLAGTSVCSSRRRSIGSPMSVASSSDGRVACLLHELQASMADSQELQRRLLRMRTTAAGLASAPLDDLVASEEHSEEPAAAAAAPGSECGGVVAEGSWQGSGLA